MEPLSIQPPWPLGFLLVGWITEDHGDLLLALDCVRVPAGLAERQKDLGKVFLLGVGIAKRVGHEEAHRRYRVRVVEKRPQFREEAQLGHGERPELDLETDKTRYGGSNNSGNSARALVSRGRVPRCGGRRRVKKYRCRSRGRRQLRSGEASPSDKLNLYSRAQGVIDEPDHAANNLGWRVVGASFLAEVVVVDAQELLVEVQPGFRVAFTDIGPMDGVEHPCQRGERRWQCCRLVGVVP